MTKLLCLTAIVVALAPALHAEEATAEKSLAIAGKGALHLRIPVSWQSATGGAQGAPTLRLVPRTGDDFTVLLTALAPRPGKDDSLTPASLRGQVEDAGRKPLETAVEKTLEIRELKGTHAQGFYFSLADREPGDSYPFMTQGLFRVGGLLVSLTVLHRTPGPAVRDAALEMVRSAIDSK